MIAVPTEPQRGNLINAGYEPRVLDRFIYENMEDFGAVCIEGPKYCGKTWTARSLSNSEICLTSGKRFPPSGTPSATPSIEAASGIRSYSRDPPFLARPNLTIAALAASKRLV